MDEQQEIHSPDPAAATGGDYRPGAPLLKTAFFAMALLLGAMYLNPFGLQARREVVAKEGAMATNFLIVKVGDFRVEIQWKSPER